MKNLSIFEPQIGNHYAYEKKNMYEKSINMDAFYGIKTNTIICEN